MKLSSRLPGFAREIGFEAFASWLAESGFDAIDTPVPTREIAQACKKAGLAYGTCDARAGGLLGADAAKRKQALSTLKKDLSAIAQFGGHTYFALLMPDDPSQPRAKTFEIFRQVYPKVVEHAEKVGVRIAIEPWPGGAPYYANLGCTPESFRRIFDAIPSPHLGISYDPSHLVRIQVDYVRFLHEFGGRVYHVHLKDTEVVEEKLYESGILGESYGHTYGFGEGWWRYTIPGEGSIDWTLVIRRLDELGYKGALSVELEDHHFWATAQLQQEGILRAKEYIEPILKGRGLR
jgi:sugar phosphate isomerase/epimerase